MEQKELGKTGVMVSEIGLGTWRYRGGVKPLQKGIELGATLIDTAEMYRTEDAVGQAIAGRRDDVFLATKVLGSHLRYDQVLRAADESLRRLAVDRIDLYQIHWSNRSVPISETMRAMEDLIDAGKVSGKRSPVTRKPSLISCLRTMEKIASQVPPTAMQTA